MPFWFVPALPEGAGEPNQKENREAKANRRSMSEYVTQEDLVDAGDKVLIRITNGDGFAWGETIKGIVTLLPEDVEAVTFSLVSVTIIEQDADGFASPVAFSGIRAPLNPLSGVGVISDGAGLSAEPLEVAYEDTVIARDVTIAPGDLPREIPFRLIIPVGIPLTAACYLTVRSEATTGLDADRHGATPFTLLPPRYLQAIRDALKTLGDFESIEITDVPRYQQSAPHHFIMDFLAPRSLQYYLDGIKFELEEKGTEITGMAIINPQEHTLADHLRSFLHADRIHIPVTFDRQELEKAANAGLPSEAATTRLHELLDPLLKPAV